MRVITGTARGRRLLTLSGEDVRPTTDKVKEALFSIIQFEIEGRQVLDLFAGSGQLGIEALSRGAAGCVFVDQSKQAINIVRRNIETCGFSDRAKVYQSDAIGWLSSYQSARLRFDIAFLDPPYASGLLAKAIPAAAEHMNRGGVIICESPAGAELPREAGEFAVYRDYRYGKTALTLYRHKDTEM